MFFLGSMSSGVFVLPAVLVPSLGSIRQRDNPRELTTMSLSSSKVPISPAFVLPPFRILCLTLHIISRILVVFSRRNRKKYICSIFLEEGVLR